MRLERYEKVKSLGEGAQGNVFLAKDTLLNRMVAIKSLHKSLVSDAIHEKRFEEEAKTLASFNHSKIIDVYDIIVNNDGCHLIMEYFEGYPLNQYIRKISGPIPEKEAIEIFLMILDAMSYIHNKGIIHRDIKPSNIMINKNSDIRLLDFGIAKNTENDTKLTQIGSSAGYTPMYMSPEHCNGSKITKLSDIYSLGVTLWQMLTGKAPYEGYTQGQIYLKVANEPLPAVQSVYHDVSLKMNEIVQKATHKEIKERYSSCVDIKKDLQKLKDQINNPKIKFLYELRIEILDDIEAEIYFNEDKHLGTEYSKSYNYGTAVEIKVTKKGYNKVRRNVEITKNETLKISLEKQKLSFSNIISESQNKLIQSISNIKPNLLNLVSLLKLNSIWIIDTIKLKLNKNQTETVKTIQNKRIETKKAIEKSFDFIKIHKKEYATYLILFTLLTTSIFGVFGEIEKEPKSKIIDTNNPKIISIANFETKEAKGEESLSAIKIPIILSEVSDSIIKIPLLFYGTADNNDYRPKTDTVFIQPNQKIGFINLEVFDDKVVESDETIEIELQPIANIETGEKQKHTYTIINNDKTSTKTTKTKPKKETQTPTTTLKQTPTVNTNQKPIQTKNTGSAYQRILRTKTWDQRSGLFDKYFLLIRKNGNNNFLTIFDYDTGKQLGPEYIIKGKNVIKNICYKNHRLYTNKGAKLLERAHLIDVRNPNSSVYFGSKIRKGYLGDGTEFTLTLYHK